MFDLRILRLACAEVGQSALSNVRVRVTRPAKPQKKMPKNMAAKLKQAATKVEHDYSQGRT